MLILSKHLLWVIPSYCGNMINSFRSLLYRDQTSLLHKLKKFGQLKQKQWHVFSLEQSSQDFNETLQTISQPIAAHDLINTHSSETYKCMNPRKLCYFPSMSRTHH